MTITLHQLGYYSSDKTKKNQMGGHLAHNEGDERCIQDFDRET